MGRSILATGGGDTESFAKLDRAFVKSLPEHSKILLLPFANDPEDYEDTHERVSETFESFGKVTVDLLDSLNKLGDDTFEDYSAVYIDGGNTFNLINEVRSSELAQYLPGFADKGGIVYGDSAGAIILGNSVQTAFLGDDGDDNESKLQSFHGLSMLGGWSFHCHFEPDDHQQVQDFVYDSGSPVLALPEPCGIQIIDMQVEVFGHAPLDIYTFGDRITVNPNDKYDLKKLGYE